MTGGPEASEGTGPAGTEVGRTITEWVDECRNWTGALLDAPKSLEAVNEKAKTLERENAQLRGGLAELRRELSDIDAARTELRTALQDLARQLAQVVDSTRRHLGK